MSTSTTTQASHPSSRQADLQTDRNWEQNTIASTRFSGDSEWQLVPTHIFPFRTKEDRKEEEGENLPRRTGIRDMKMTDSVVLLSCRRCPHKQGPDPETPLPGNGRGIFRMNNLLKKVFGFIAISTPTKLNFRRKLIYLSIINLCIYKFHILDHKCPLGKRQISCRSWRIEWCIFRAEK